MRKLFLKTDQNVSMEDKAKTLIIEWSGANDLITVNKRPERKAVDKAIQARVANLKNWLQRAINTLCYLIYPI